MKIFALTLFVLFAATNGLDEEIDVLSLHIYLIV